MTRDLILHEMEIQKINGCCKCGVEATVEREASLEYVTPQVSHNSSPAQMVQEPQVRVGHNSYLVRVLPHVVFRS